MAEVLPTFLLWHLRGMAALGLLAAAIVGAFVAAATWERVFGGVMTGVASIVGGTIGAMAFAGALQLSIHMSAVWVFSGAACGGVGWMVFLLTSVLERVKGLGTSETKRLEQPRATWNDARAYLVASLVSLNAGPFLGGAFYLFYSAALYVHPMDRFDYLAYHMLVGTIGGMLVGVPYLCVWLTRIAQIKGRRR